MIDVAKVARSTQREGVEEEEISAMRPTRCPLDLPITARATVARGDLSAHGGRPEAALSRG